MNDKHKTFGRCSDTLMVALFLAPLVTLNTAFGEIRLMPCFSSDMVFQREVPARIAGWADVGEAVVVKLGDKVVGKTVGAGVGTVWTVTLPVFKSGAIPDLTIEGKNSITLTHLLAGDVWICSGQSNMEMSLQAGPWCKYGGVLNVEQEVAAAVYPQLRLFNAREKEPWRMCTPESAKCFSAAGYFFGRELAQQLAVPVGLVQVAVGGTAAEYWLPRVARETWPGFAVALKEAQQTQRELGPLEEADRSVLAQWQKTVDEAKKSGSPLPPKPLPRLEPKQKERLYTAHIVENTGFYYDKRIAPLTMMPIKGAIWYQGEANIPRHAEYQELMTQLIGSWRQAWGQAEMPFLIMQLVNFGSPSGQGNSLWSELRAAQQRVAETVPHVGLAVGIDIGEPNNIHPKNKQEVGRRLALVALKQVYGQDVVATGPKLISATCAVGKVTLRFEPGDKGQSLVLKSGADSGFEVAGKDGKFVTALVAVQGHTITLSVPTVTDPRVVRYAWKDSPCVTLFNTTGLPAAPFQKQMEVGSIK